MRNFSFEGWKFQKIRLKKIKFKKIVKKFFKFEKFVKKAFKNFPSGELSKRIFFDPLIDKIIKSPPFSIFR